MKTRENTHTTGAVLSDTRFPVRLHGQTSHFAIFVRPKLRERGIAVANAILNRCEDDYNIIATMFGNAPKPQQINVIVVQGSDAYHTPCESNDLYCGISGPHVWCANMRLVMEEVELFSVFQGKGWNPLASNGEALSRVIAGELYPGFVKPLSSYWLGGSENRRNYVDQNDPTDTNHESLGCAMLFLYYLRFQLHFTWHQIIQTGAPTLAGVYTNLTGRTDGWTAFNSTMESIAIDEPSLLRSGNPFPCIAPAVSGKSYLGEAADQNGDRILQVENGTR